LDWISWFKGNSVIVNKPYNGSFYTIIVGMAGSASSAGQLQQAALI
jgi:hypothetical protein